MSEKRSASAQQALEVQGVDLRVIEFPDSTRTAVEAAQAVGCDVGQIVKSLIFKGKKTPYLVLVSGANRVDEKKLRRIVGEKIGKADADFVRAHTGFAIGGVSPVGHKEPLQTVIDEDLLPFDQLWAARRTPSSLSPPPIFNNSQGGQIEDVKRKGASL